MLPFLIGLPFNSRGYFLYNFKITSDYFLRWINRGKIHLSCWGNKSLRGHDDSHLGHVLISLNTTSWGHLGVVCSRGGKAEKDLILFEPATVSDCFVDNWTCVWIRRINQVLDILATNPGAVTRLRSVRTSKKAGPCPTYPTYFDQ